MVCLGNICRSPLAEGILQYKVNASKVQVDSAGLDNYHEGELPDRRSIQVANENSIDITNQRARPFQSNDFDIYDIIYAMDRSVYYNLLKMASSEREKEKVKLILNEVHPNKNLDVPDPYYESIIAFRNVFNMLDEACDQIIETLD